MLCPHCQNENRDGAKFCDQCGAPLERLAPTTPEVAMESDEPLGKHSRVDDEQPIDDADEETGRETDVFHDSEHGEDKPEIGEDPSPSLVDAEDEEAAQEDGENVDVDGAESDDGPADEKDDEVEAEDNTDNPDDDENDSAGENPEEPCDAEPEQSENAPASSDPTESLNADFAGFDRQAEDYGERVVNANWQPDQSAFHDGGTMQMPRVEDDQAHQTKEYLASSQVEKPKGKVKKIAAIVIVLIALAAAIAAYSTYQMELWGGKVVPDVAGMTEADARSVLVSKGFKVRSAQVKSDDTEGLVLIMDPSAGSRLEDGSEVVIHITATRTIPEIVGRTRAAAAKDLAEAGYVHVNFVEKASSKTKGTVISVKPGEGKEAKSTDEITVTIAIPFTVPDVTGMYVDEAIATIQDAGFTCDVAYYDTPDYAENTVVNTDPAAGSEVEEGAYIVINVAQARSQKLEQATIDYLAEGVSVNVDGTNYTIVSLDSVSYQGDNTVAYSATAKPYTVFFGYTFEADPVQINGVVTFNENDEIVGVS